MRSLKNILLLLQGALIMSCTNQAQNSTDTANRIDAVEKDLAYGEDGISHKSPIQVELEQALMNEAIAPYYKEIYRKGEIIVADEERMLSISDSLFTNDTATDLFYFIVFTKSMNGADGLYAEMLGLTALDFLRKKTENFANYFNIVPSLTDSDMELWASFVYSEIQISGKNEVAKSLVLLEKRLFKNIGANRKEYTFVIKKFMDVIQKIHRANMDGKD